MARKGLSTPNMLSGANVFEISDIQNERNRESVLKKRTLHGIENLPPYQFASDRLGGASAVGLARALAGTVWRYVPAVVRLPSAITVIMPS